MKTQAVSHLWPFPAIMPRAGASHALWRFVMDRFLLVPLGALIALVWANTAAESYFRTAQALAFPVNEVAMAFFLALVVQEVFEAAMPGGALHTWRRWGMPILAAAGGIAGAVFTFLGYVYLRQEEVLRQAWPIAMAIDMTAAYYLLKLIAPRTSALPFVLVLAIATDAVGLLVMAVWPAVTPAHIVGAMLVFAGVGTAAVMHRRRVRRFWPYFALSGTLSWVGFYLADVHPALALVPIVPFLPHEPRPLDVFADQPADDRVHRAEHEWNEWVQIVVFLFALINAGVMLRGYDVGTWALLLAALVGRPLGILAAVAVGLAVGLHLPRHLGWRQLVVIAIATSGGFTVALFFASGLLSIGGVSQQIRFGALLSVLGAPAAILAARLLHVGRFGQHARSEGGGHGLSA